MTSQTFDHFCQDVIYSGIHSIQGNRLLETTFPRQRVSTGFAKLDEILNGGLLRGSITEFAGPTNTCKTVVFPIPLCILRQLLSNIILSRLSTTPDVRAVYIDTLGTLNPSILQALLSRYPDASPSILDRIHLVTALDMVSLVDSCESIKKSLTELVPIEMLVIDTIANPLSLLMNKGQLQGHRD